MGAISSIFGAQQIGSRKIDSVGLGVMGSVDWWFPGPLGRLTWLQAAFPCALLTLIAVEVLKADRAEDFDGPSEENLTGSRYLLVGDAAGGK